MNGEPGVALLGGGQAISRRKALWIGELPPGRLMTGSGQIEVPRHEAQKFARIREGTVFLQDFEELRVGVPQARLHKSAQPRGFGLVFHRHFRLPG